MYEQKRAAFLRENCFILLGHGVVYLEPDKAKRLEILGTHVSYDNILLEVITI